MPQIFYQAGFIWKWVSSQSWLSNLPDVDEPFISIPPPQISSSQLNSHPLGSCNDSLWTGVLSVWTTVYRDLEADSSASPQLHSQQLRGVSGQAHSGSVPGGKYVWSIWRGALTSVGDT